MKCGLLKTLLLTLLFYGECAAAPIQRSTHYTTADGLAHNSVQGFCIDSSGMLWICSWFALERFDGYCFESFRPEEQQEFSRFKMAYLGDDDRILVTTTGGQTLTFSLKDYTFKSGEDTPREGDERFRRSLTDAYGNRWEEANAGVWFTPHEATDYTLIRHEKYPIPRLFFEDSEARLWISWGGQIGTKERGGELSYRWFYYPEAGTFAYEASRTGAPLKINNDNEAEAWFTVPRTVRLGTMHIILEVTDKGTPALTRYRRVIIDVTE